MIVIEKIIDVIDRSIDFIDVFDLGVNFINVIDRSLEFIDVYEKTYLPETLGQLINFLIFNDGVDSGEFLYNDITGGGGLILA